MTAFTQDTWILNVAMQSEENKFRHWCRIELPAELSSEEAEIRSEEIVSYFLIAATTAVKWQFTLTRWEVRGHQRREFNV